MSPRLPTYINSASSYQPIGSHSHVQPSKPSRFLSFRIAILLLFLATFILISGKWASSHPNFLQDLRLARTISINARIKLQAYTIPHKVTTSQEMAVPQVEASILGVTAETGTPNWKTGAAATIAATASIPAYPRRIQPSTSAPRSDEILFAMATTADRAISQAQWWLWPSFLTNPSSPCFVLLPPEDAHRVEEVIAAFHEQGLDCIARASEQKRYQRRVLALPKEAMKSWSGKQHNIRWLIMGDDDTLWLDKNGLLRLLGQHDEREMKFIASTSERIESLNWFGRMTFGGGGLIMSTALVDKYIEVLPECEKRWPTTFGGDEAVNNCAALAQGVNSREEAYIPEAGLHQFDVYGDASGFLESGLPMMTLHHFFSWAKMMPHWMHRNDDYRSLHVLIQAAHFLGQDNMFKRYSMDGGRTILVNGYSITTHLEPLSSEDLTKMEWTWSHAPDGKLVTENVRPPITPIGYIPAENDQPGSQRKSPYFLQAVENVDEDKSRAMFVYRNERGKEIVIEWEERKL